MPGYGEAATIAKAATKRMLRFITLQPPALGPFSERIIPELRAMETPGLKILSFEPGGNPFHEELSVRFQLVRQSASGGPRLAFTCSSSRSVEENLAEFRRFVEQGKAAGTWPGTPTEELLAPGINHAD
jgi:hypothetical protein